MKLFVLLIFSFFITNNIHAQDTKTILFFGDSITAGYGLEQSEAFPAHIQSKIDELGLEYKVINGGLSGETSAGGLRRINWVLQRPIDVMILELGGNDGLRGIDLSDTRKNLQGIIDKAQAKYPSIQIIIAGMQVPPNLGIEYTKEFSNLYVELAQQNELPLIPFILEQVGGKEDLNLPDGIHPNAEGHKLVAETVWEYLYPVLKK